MSISLTFDTIQDFVIFVNGVSTNPSTNTRLDTIIAMLTAVKQEEDVMAADLTQLQAAVASNTTVIASAETLISGIAAQLATAIASLPNPADLQALQMQLQNDDAGLAAAVAANTPVAPPGPTGATGPGAPTGATGP